MGKVMERRYICRNIVEKTRFFVGDNTALHPRWRKGKTMADKREENHRRAARELARIYNCNLDGSGFLVTLTYSDAAHEKLFAGLDEDQILRESKRLAGLFVRRLKRKAGTEIKYTYEASDRKVLEDGTLEPVRVHNHIVVMGASMEQIRECWNYGLVDMTSIYENQEDYTPLAVYLVSQVRSLPDFKKYNASRNMDKPKVEERVVVGDPADEIRVQPGAKVLDRMTYREGSVVQYVRYRKKPRAVKRGGRKALSVTPEACQLPQSGSQDAEEGGAGFEFSKAAWV